MFVGHLVVDPADVVSPVVMRRIAVKDFAAGIIGLRQKGRELDRRRAE